MDDLTLAALLLDFPDDEACSIIATARDSGAIVWDDPWGETGWQYTATLNGHRYVGRGGSDVEAARALLLAMGYDPAG